MIILQGSTAILLVSSALAPRKASPRKGSTASMLWVVKVGGDDGELRSWHYIYVYSIESRLIMRVRYDSPCCSTRPPNFHASIDQLEVLSSIDQLEVFRPVLINCPALINWKYVVGSEGRRGRPSLCSRV